MIKLEEISAGYGKKQVLYGVSASFQKGKITSVVGPNGCGKSTLLKSVLGIVPLTGGRVTAASLLTAQGRGRSPEKSRISPRAGACPT